TGRLTWYPPTASANLCGSCPTSTDCPGGCCRYLGWLGYNDRDYRYHEAIDLCNGNQAGSPVYSIGPGEVLFSRTDVGGYGPGSPPGGAVVVRHRAADGTYFTALYGHLTQPHAVGQIQAGEVVGYSNAWSPPHIHLGIHPGYDPQPVSAED